LSADRCPRIFDALESTFVARAGTTEWIPRAAAHYECSLTIKGFFDVGGPPTDSNGLRRDHPGVGLQSCGLTSEITRASWFTDGRLAREPAPAWMTKQGSSIRWTARDEYSGVHHSHLFVHTTRSDGGGPMLGDAS
jgi:hypothetical protein